MTEMEYTNLGDTGLEVSRLCLGCMNFGTEWGGRDAAGTKDVVDAALDAGINFLDTANVYSHGESEEFVGRAIDGRRDELVLATKVYGDMADRPNGGGLSRKHILEQVEASLDRLGTDYIDLYQIHRWDDDTPVEETLSALDHLVEEGLVRYVGASSMDAWKFVRALERSDAENYERFVSMQPEYSLTNRHEEHNVLPACDAYDVGVIPWSPLAGGFLAGKYERGEPAPEGSRYADADEPPEEQFSDAEWAVLDEVRALADEKDATPAQVSLAWLLHKDVVTAPIVGPRTVDHLDDALGALDVSLSDDAVARLEDPVDPAYRGV